MLKTKAAFRLLAAVSAVVLALALASETRIDAHSQSKGATLAGTWYLSVPSGLRTLLAFHADGTSSQVSSFGFGGPPITPLGPVARSADLGIWSHRAGNRFEVVTFRFDYELGSGNALQITRIRSVFRLDRGFESGSGQFFVTQWSCPTPTTCPDPNLSAPDPPGEVAPPGNTFTMTRVRIR